ncbi:nucleotide exchange factor GrpE [Candidatus Endobugula sertula]|uniref:Protein GrpE n=1 Tax=Candidatus Endobugula sertula TaxID=62101 RepID=A0A1D2QS15_9GAMM|nr:nucleotide exchange factor GrpE [Candidatus Endobugula sertula]
MECGVSKKTQDKPAENISEEAVVEKTVADATLETIEDAQEQATEVEELDSVGQVLTEEIAALKDQVLRAQAETMNIRRRAEQDVEKARKFALEKFVNDLLPVADNLERAITAGDAQDESQKAILEGVELTLKSLMDTLKKYHVEAINPESEPFDPQLHQAMSMAPNPDVEPNTVLNVFQKGYTLNGRLVRPAMVVVSSAD